MMKYVSFVVVLLHLSDVRAMEPERSQENSVARLRRVFSEPSLRQSEVRKTSERKSVRREYASKTVRELRQIWEQSGDVNPEEEAEKTTLPRVARSVSTSNEKNPQGSPGKLQRRVASFWNKFGRKSPLIKQERKEVQPPEMKGCSLVRGRSETMPIRPLSPRSLRLRSPSFLEIAGRYYDDFLHTFSNSTPRGEDVVITKPEIDADKTSCHAFSMDVFQERLSKLLIIYDALNRIIPLHIQNLDIDSRNALSVQKDLEQLGEMHKKGQLLKRKLEKAKEEQPIRASFLEEAEKLQKGFAGENVNSETLESLSIIGLEFVVKLERYFFKNDVRVYLEEKFDVEHLARLEEDKSKLVTGLREALEDIKKIKHDSRAPQVVKSLGKVRKLLISEQRELETAGAEFIQSLERFQKSFYRVIKFATNQRGSLSPDELAQFAKKVESTLKDGENVSMTSSSSRAMITHPGKIRRSPSNLRKTRRRAQTEADRRRLKLPQMGS